MTRPTLPPDTHTHTHLCKHATGDSSQYARRAAESGAAAITFTDHAPAPDGYDPAVRMDIAAVPEYLRIVGEARAAVTIPVGLGIEADYYPGAASFLDRWLRTLPFDLVLGSVHYIDDWAFDNPAEADVWTSADLRGAWSRYFALIAAMADTRLYDAAAHLDLPKVFGHRLADDAMRDIAAPALDRIAAAGMSIEINTAGLRKAAREIYPSPLLLAMAAERGIPILFGSDAHRPEDVAHSFEEAVALARSVGYREYAVYSGRTRRSVPL